VVAALRLQARLDLFFTAYQENFILILLDCINGSLYFRFRAAIAAHGIQCDTDHQKSPVGAGLSYATAGTGRDGNVAAVIGFILKTP
jgi:hypothetical protein